MQHATEQQWIAVCAAERPLLRLPVATRRCQRPLGNINFDFRVGKTRRGFHIVAILIVSRKKPLPKLVARAGDIANQRKCFMCFGCRLTAELGYCLDNTQHRLSSRARPLLRTRWQMLLSNERWKQKKDGYQGMANLPWNPSVYPINFNSCCFSAFGNTLRKWSSNRSCDSSGFLLYTISTKDLP